MSVKGYRRQKNAYRGVYPIPAEQVVPNHEALETTAHSPAQSAQHFPHGVLGSSEIHVVKVQQPQVGHLGEQPNQLAIQLEPEARHTATQHIERDICEVGAHLREKAFNLNFASLHQMVGGTATAVAYRWEWDMRVPELSSFNVAEVR